MDSVQISNAWFTNSRQHLDPGIEGLQKDFDPAFFKVLPLAYMCNSCSSKVVHQLEEHNNKETIGSLGNREDTDTRTVQFQAYIHIRAIMSCTLCSACSSLLLYAPLQKVTFPLQLTIFHAWLQYPLPIHSHLLISRFLFYFMSMCICFLFNQCKCQCVCA